MISPLLMPCIIITISILAAIVYGLQGDYRHCAYWLAGAVLNISVTF